MDFKIRDFVSDDAEAVHAVAMNAWRASYREIYDSTYIERYVNTYYAPQRLRSLAKRVAQNEVFFVVAENETGVIGFCNIGQTQQGMELFRIYMLPDFVGQGIGGLLLAKGEQYLRKQGFSSYFCFVHSANEVGKRFYEKQGFQHVPEHDCNDEWFMEKQLPESGSDVKAQS
jgi:ribosomal protein S18 acetylase RimI-like enzyme